MINHNLLGQIIGKIVVFIQQHGGNRAEWYVGISSDFYRRALEHRLSSTPIFSENIHGVDTARAVEKHFVEIQKTDGAPGGGDDNSTTVYAFRKTRDTDPSLR